MTYCFKFLVVYYAKHREYQLVAKSTVPCVLTRVIFMTNYSGHQLPNFGTSKYVLYKIALLQK